MRLVGRIGVLAAQVAAAVLAGCGDDSGSQDATSSADVGSSDASSTSESSTSESSTAPATAQDSSSEGSSSGESTGEPATSEGSSSDGSSASGESSSESSSACVEIEFEMVEGASLSGWAYCGGVSALGVIDDQSDVDAHVAAYCDSLAECEDPDPACPPIPALPEPGTRIVYVWGDSGACSGAASIGSILDCGDTVEVHYAIYGLNPCAPSVKVWKAVSIPAGSEQVVFVPS